MNLDGLKAAYNQMIPLRDFVLPIEVQKDCEYENTLNIVLDEYLKCIKKIDKVDSTALQSTEKNVTAIKMAIKYYYDANISSAKESIEEIIKPYISNNYIVSLLNESPALRGITRIVNNSINDKLANAPLALFKARTGTETYNREEFLHIPFNKRGLVATQRFSIAGVPCMYFGASSYVCWLELGKPEEKIFNISSYEFSHDLTILNLAITQDIINGFLLQNNDDSNNNMSLIEIFPLVIATSFRVLEDRRSFKSEYIISQLIMQSIAELKIEGVAYISKRIETNNTSIQTGIENFPTCVNLAIPMKTNNKKNYSAFAQEVRLTVPVNLEKYLDSNPEHDGSKVSYANLFESSIINSGERIPYNSLNYSRLDDYLVNLDHKNYKNS